MTVVTPLTEVLPSEALSDEPIAGPWLRHGAAPEAVVHPETTEEVAATLRWAEQSEVSVVPVGSGRRLGGPWRDGRFIVLSTRRLSGIEAYEPADLTVTAGAGTRLSSLDGELRRYRQWLPCDPPDATDRTLGGLVATAESGPLWMGYGELRNHVLGLRVVCGDGRTLQLGGRVVKNVAGFDLLKPMVGSRGRLGVITSVCTRAFPVPATDRLLALEAESTTALAYAALQVGTAPVLPVSSVLIEPARSLSGRAALLVRLHGAEPTVDADQRTLEEHVGTAFDVVDDAVATLSEARDHASTGAVVLVIAVRPSGLGEALSAAGSVGAVAVAADTYAARVRVATDALDRTAVAHLRDAVEAIGGSVAVRAGATPDLLSAASSLSSEALALSERVERVFDPGGVLWPPRP